MYSYIFLIFYIYVTRIHDMVSQCVSLVLITVDCRRVLSYQAKHVALAIQHIVLEILMSTGHDSFSRLSSLCWEVSLMGCVSICLFLAMCSQHAKTLAGKF